MKKELVLALIMVFSWASATFFTEGADDIIDKYVTKYHHKAVIHIGVAFIFILIIIYLSTRQIKSK